MPDAAPAPRGARRLRAAASAGLAVLSVGVQIICLGSEGLRRPFGARVRPVAARRRAGRGEVPRVRRLTGNVLPATYADTDCLGGAYEWPDGAAAAKASGLVH